MSKLTTQDIVDAYKTVGCRPMRGNFLRKDWKGHDCMCVLSALYVSHGGTFDDIDLDDISVDTLAGKIADKIGVTEEFAIGLMHAWDGDNPTTEYMNHINEDRRAGYQLGMIAYDEVSEKVERVLEEYEEEDEDEEEDEGVFFVCDEEDEDDSNEIL